jgi:DNA-directed RNA polymerase specialized sigma24 family protein
MKTDHQSPADAAGRFRTTRWSAVLLSAEGQAPGSQAALAELWRIYWYPIYAFVRRGGHNADDARDLTQGFLLHLLDHKALRQVSPFKGKFRSFLAASLQNYLLDEADHARRLKRGGNIDFLREEVDRTVSKPGTIDEEIHALCEALIATEGRLGP